MGDCSGIVTHRRVVNTDGSEKQEKEIDEGSEDVDSKEVRLNLMEEILLLGLKEREGYLSFWNDTISSGLRGCILIELALRGRISLSPAGARRRSLRSRLVVIKSEVPTGDAILDEALRLMKTNKQETIKRWLEYLTGETWNPFKLTLQMRNVRERIAKNLVEKGVCTTEKQNFVVFDLLTHPLVDIHTKHRVVQRVQDAILNRWSTDLQKIDRRLLSLVLLANHSEVLDSALATLSDIDYDLAKKRVISAVRVDYAAEAAKDTASEVVWAVLDSLND